MTPIEIKIIPDKKNIVTIRLAQPFTKNPMFIDLYIIQNAVSNEMMDIQMPNIMVILKGFSEKDSTMSNASFSLFFNVYEGFPENRIP